MESATLFNPLKVFFCLPPALSVIQANQSASAQTGTQTLRTGPYSIGTTFLFLYPSLPTKKKKNLLFLVGDARCHWLHLRAADHGRMDNTSGDFSLSLSVSFFSQQNALDWQSLSPEGETAGLKSIV